MPAIQINHANPAADGTRRDHAGRRQREGHADRPRIEFDGYPGPGTADNQAAPSRPGEGTTDVQSRLTTGVGHRPPDADEYADHRADDKGQGGSVSRESATTRDVAPPGVDVTDVYGRCRNSGPSRAFGEPCRCQARPFGSNRGETAPARPRNSQGETKDGGRAAQRRRNEESKEAKQRDRHTRCGVAEADGKRTRSRRLRAGTRGDEKVSGQLLRGGALGASSRAADSSKVAPGRR